MDKPIINDRTIQVFIEVRGGNIDRIACTSREVLFTVIDWDRQVGAGDASYLSYRQVPANQCVSQGEIMAYIAGVEEEDKKAINRIK